MPLRPPPCLPLQCVLQRRPVAIGYWGSLVTTATQSGFCGSLTTVSTFVAEVRTPAPPPPSLHEQRACRDCHHHWMMPVSFAAARSGPGPWPNIRFPCLPSLPASPAAHPHRWSSLRRPSPRTSAPTATPCCPWAAASCWGWASMVGQSGHTREVGGCLHGWLAGRLCTLLSGSALSF